MIEVVIVVFRENKRESDAFFLTLKHRIFSHFIIIVVDFASIAIFRHDNLSVELLQTLLVQADTLWIVKVSTGLETFQIISSHKNVRAGSAALSLGC